MTDSSRRIGLSLGADLCWPVFYEDIMERLGPIRVGGETHHLDVERIRIEPYDLRQPVDYDVVLDRLTHWYDTSREWLKKAIVMHGTYILNNPYTLQAMEKHTSYVAMMRLGLPVPDTWMLPPKDYEPTDDLDVTLDRYAELFDLAEVGRKVGYPAFLKPFSGGGWVGVQRVGNADELQRAYDESGTRLMHLQAAVDPYDLFVRVLGVGPQINVIRYDPDAALHDRYKVDFDFVDGDEHAELVDLAYTINSFFGWDFNSCEALRSNGTFHPIDYANACPDSQVTSLHFHIPWLVKAKVRWSIFCAITRRQMRVNMDWDPYFEIADTDAPYREKLAAYADIGRARLDADAFDEFCADHLQDLDEIALDYFGSDHAREVVRKKVDTMFPSHEVDQFTDHFWGLIQFWRTTEADRMAAS